MKKIFGEVVTELKLDELGLVSGGVMTDSQMDLLRSGLTQAKQSGMTKEEVLRYVPTYYRLLHPQYPNVTLDEVIDYINQNWDLL